MQWVGNHINDGLRSRLTCSGVSAVREEAPNDHPDHLGSSSFITDAIGYATQHLQYLPFGETFVDQKAGSFDSRYKFSAKEKDDETGYSYFGARYYDSDLSVWLSVDPMAHKYPNMSPYEYAANNPLYYVDPNGMTIDPTFEGESDTEIEANKALFLQQVNTVTGGNYEITDNGLQAVEGNYGEGVNAELFKEGILSDNCIPMTIVNNEEKVFVDSYNSTAVDVGDLALADEVTQKAFNAHFTSERIAAGGGYSDQKQRSADLKIKTFGGISYSNFGSYHNVGLNYESRAIEEALNLPFGELRNRVEMQTIHGINFRYWHSGSSDYYEIQIHINPSGQINSFSH